MFCCFHFLVALNRQYFFGIFSKISFEKFFAIYKKIFDNLVAHDRKKILTKNRISDKRFYFLGKGFLDFCFFLQKRKLNDGNHSIALAKTILRIMKIILGIV